MRVLRAHDLAAQGDEHIGERRLALLPVPGVSSRAAALLP